MKNIKILEKYWFDTVGLLIVEDTITNEKYVYIGNASGLNIEKDINTILGYGAKYSLKTFQKMLDL